MKKMILMLILMLSSSPLFAQNYNVAQKESKVTISGTSTVHDWESVAEKISGNASIQINDGKLISVDNMKFEVAVDGIKSGKGGMDKKTYGALDEKNHPAIIFEPTEISNIGQYKIQASGNLTVAGVTKEIDMSVSYEITEDGSITFKGIQPIKMTDHNVQPPSAVFGTIKAGNEVAVQFDVKFIQ